MGKKQTCISLSDIIFTNVTVPMYSFTSVTLCVYFLTNITLCVYFSQTLHCVCISSQMLYCVCVLPHKCYIMCVILKILHSVISYVYNHYLVSVLIYINVILLDSGLCERTSIFVMILYMRAYMLKL